MEKHKQIYKTKRWIETRKAVFQRDKGVCFFCGKLILKRWTVHHKIELDEHNYLDEAIAFGLDNLVLAHASCHDIYHKRFGYKEVIVNDDLSIDYGRRKT